MYNPDLKAKYVVPPISIIVLYLITIITSPLVTIFILLIVTTFSLIYILPKYIVPTNKYKEIVIIVYYILVLATMAICTLLLVPFCYIIGNSLPTWIASHGPFSHDKWGYCLYPIIPSLIMYPAFGFLLYRPYRTYMKQKENILKKINIRKQKKEMAKLCKEQP